MKLPVPNCGEKYRLRKDIMARCDRLKRTIIQLSLSIAFVFACYVAGMYGPWRKSRSLLANKPPARGAVVNRQDNGTPDVKEHDKRHPIVPPTFGRVDFTNFSYGHDEKSSGKKIKLTLEDGEHRYDYPDLDRGWVAFDEVYFADLTGDGTPEAVVLLSHVQCGVSCDGGSALIYIYSARKGKLEKLWRYETGSLAYGCGLKSFSVQERQIIVETFGRCPHSAKDYPGSAKFVIEDMTRSVFRFNGRRFTRQGVEFISAPATDVKNYKPEIRIN